ncbi:MAG TPA: NRDE family protein [Gammaproteobacteria bacterium]|nr:NRDE family protein [Gammaproteobacteria bacterium]
MCLLAFAWKTHPDYRLIFAGNRDEFHARPTAAADWWEDAPHVLGGRDLAAGGTWLGLTDQGRFAVVTNYREPGAAPPAEALSRGTLATDFLIGTSTPHTYLNTLRAGGGARFAGFNLLFGELAGDKPALFYYSNRSGATDLTGELSAGIYGLSNHLLDTPWPKVQHLKAAMQLNSAEPSDTETLLGALGDRTLPDDAELPNTGVSPAHEKLLSPACIVSPDYGTRASSIVTVANTGQTQFIELTRNRDGEPAGRKEYSFNLIQ